ncbi:MAG TPA: alpha/beta hydrolase [Conexibacter sp.]
MTGAAQLHPQCEEILRRIERWGGSVELTIEQARADEERRKDELAGVGPELYEVRQLTVPGPAGVLPAVAYRATADVAPGVLVWLHGGGWAVGSPATCDAQVRAIAAGSGCTVLSIDYRLAPEHRFPSAVEDAYAAVAWAADHADQLGARTGRLAVGGDSAGGNLAAATTLLARDRGGPVIDFQLLVYPATCCELDAPSRGRYAEGHWLTQAAMEFFWRSYLATPEDATSPYASPLLAESVHGLPPALVVLAECDVLHDEGERYAQRLQEAGSAVEVRRYEGMLHGFLAVAGVVESAWDVLRDAGRAVGDALVRSPERAA